MFVLAEASGLQLERLDCILGRSAWGEHEPYERALRLGSYDWSIPDLDSMLREADSILVEEKKGKDKEEKKGKLNRALEAVPCAAIRCGLAHPAFDADSLANMPFRKATTVVADTNSVLQGGLDFAVRFLYPYARVKIPAVVHMEILNMVDRYFIQRRKKHVSASTLHDHVTSQGGQRVLLRLELQTDAEIERPRVGSRSAAGDNSGGEAAEDRSLGLQEIQKSFADRLVLDCYPREATTECRSSGSALDERSRPCTDGLGRGIATSLFCRQSLQSTVWHGPYRNLFQPFRKCSKFESILLHPIY